jgi:hypothetical protein
VPLHFAAPATRAPRGPIHALFSRRFIGLFALSAAARELHGLLVAIARGL